MRTTKATLDADSGVVEVAVRGHDLANHGYFLGVREEGGRGSFVALTRAEAEAVAANLLDRIDPTAGLPAQAQSHIERLIWLCREEDHATAALERATERATAARSELRAHIGYGDALPSSLRRHASEALFEAAMSGVLVPSTETPDQPGVSS